MLMNVALHGMEQAAGVRYHATGVNAGQRDAGHPVLVRYADDLVAMCYSREQAEQVKATAGRLAGAQGPGLQRGQDATSSTSKKASTSWASHVRRYRNQKLLIKPSKAAVKRIRERLAAEMLALRGANADAVIAKLTPIIRGWAAYYRTACPARLLRTGHLPVAAHLQVGQARATRTSRGTGSFTGTSTRSTPTGQATDGCSATASVAATCASSPGRRSSDTSWSRSARPRTTRP